MVFKDFIDRKGDIERVNNALQRENAQKRAVELDHLKGELVIITDANGKSFKGFFRNVEFIIKDNRITARYTVCHILECNGIIMASEHTYYVYDAVDIRKTSYKNYRYNV